MEFPRQGMPFSNDSGMGGLPFPSLTEMVPEAEMEVPRQGIPFSNNSEAWEPRADELPRTLTIRGSLYQKVETGLGGDVRPILNRRPGGPSLAYTPFSHQDQYHVPGFDQGSFQGLSSSDRQREHLFASDELQQGEIGSRLEDVLSVQPTVPKRERTPTMVREVEPYDEVPEPESDLEQARLPSESTCASMPTSSMPTSSMPTSSMPTTSMPTSSMPTSSMPTSSKPQRKSLMLRQIEAHNKPPKPKTNPKKEILCDVPDDWRDAPITRGAREDLVNHLTGNAPTVRKNLNLTKLMLAEFSGIVKGTKTYYNIGARHPGSSSRKRQQGLMKDMSLSGEEETEEEDLPTITKTKRGSHPQPMPTRRTTSRLMGTSMDMKEDPIEEGHLVQDFAAELAVVRWNNQNDRITELVKSPRYNPHPSPQEIIAQGRKKPAYHITADGPEGVQRALSMEKGLYVFTPTVADLLDFSRFLKDVEEIAGRKMGVVKVIVPAKYLSPAPSPSSSKSSRSSVIKTMSVNISEHEGAAAKRCKVYHMLTESDSNSLGASEWLRTIQQEKNKIIEKRGISAGAISHDDVWKESHVIRPFTERNMLQHGVMREKAVRCALNEPASPVLRAALKCELPFFETLPGNRFAGSRSTKPGIDQPVFHLVADPGPLFPLGMNKYAAYSVNYHHSGAPRTVTVTLPEYHAKIEKVVYDTQNFGTLSGRPREPPTCSQYVEHQSMYVPCGTLSFHEIEYTRVVQHQGEMVITFPYAYHQAYASGPNITEEILYASDRCKVFHREKLYQHCNHNCAAGQPDDFDLDLVFSNTLSSTRSGDCRRSGLGSLSTSLSLGQSSEASNPQQSDADGRSSKRVPGLKDMDRITDDGEWTDPSAQAHRHQPSKHCKTTRMTSDPHKADIWDPDHVFEGPRSPANNDEGSPVGGIRPRGLVSDRLPMPQEPRVSKRNRGDGPDEALHKYSRTH